MKKTGVFKRILLFNILLLIFTLVSCGFRGCGAIDVTNQLDSFEQLEIISETLTNIEDEFLDENGKVSIEDVPEFIDQIYETVKDSEYITYCEKNPFNVWVVLQDGLHCIYEAPIEGFANSGDEIAIYTYQPFYYDFSVFEGFPLRHGKAPLNSIEALTELNITSDTVQGALNQAVTLETIKNLKGNSVIWWIGHGSYTNSDHSALVLSILVTDELRYGDDYKNDFDDGLLIYYPITKHVGVTYKFLEKYLSNGALNNSIVYLGACESGKDKVLAETFIKKGALAVYVNTDTVFQGYNNQMSAAVLDALGDGQSASQALRIAKDKYGETDNYLQADPWRSLHSEVVCYGDQDITLNSIYANIVADNKLGTYNGTYTAPQGLMGMTLSVYKTEELLNDDILLQKYADIATQCSKSNEEGEDVVFTPDMVSEIISRHKDEYIALFNYYPVVDEEAGNSPNPDVEEGLYTMSIGYNLETGKFDFVGSEWIQHESYDFADLKNVTFDSGKLTGDVYGWQGIGFLVTYEDLGDFEANSDGKQAGYRIIFENASVELEVDKELDVNVIVKNNLGLLSTESVNIRWFSADENIVKIEGENWGDNAYGYASAHLVGINEGETTIYAELDNKRIASCTVRVNSFDFKLNGDGKGYTVTGIGSITYTDIIIPSTYKGLPVTAFSDWAFVDTNITSIVIPDTVTVIPEGVFRNCFELHTVVLPESIIDIGYYAFDDCENLKTINIPKSVKRIGYAAFTHCLSLEVIYIPVSVTKIDFYAFNHCENLRTIVYEGTIAQWNDIYKGGSWSAAVPAGYVICSDGRAFIDE